MLWILQGFTLQPALVLVTSSNLWLVLYSKERCMYDVSVDRGPNPALTCRGGESSGILYHNVAGQASQSIFVALFIRFVQVCIGESEVSFCLNCLLQAAGGWHIHQQLSVFNGHNDLE